MIDFSELTNIDDFDPDSFGLEDSTGYVEDVNGDSDYDEIPGIEAVSYIKEYGDLDILDSDIETMTSLSPDSLAEINDNAHMHNHFRSSNIAFTGNGRCSVCNCGGWAGFGDTCANCGHFYNKHI